MNTRVVQISDMHSLIDLIGILVIVAGLMFPALQASCEAARRSAWRVNSNDQALLSNSITIQAGLRCFSFESTAPDPRQRIAESA